MKRQRVKYFTGEEKRKLLDFLQKNYPNKLAKRSAFMFRLMFSTGLRLAETTQLNVGDVRDKSVLIVIGKGNKERDIPLSTALQGEIFQFLEWKKMNNEDVSQSAPLFISRKRRRMGNRAVQHDLDKWIKRADIEGKYSPHALRHTVGFELMRKTKNIRQVQEFLGHRFITTTQIYTHVTKDELRECAELLVCDPGEDYLRIPLKTTGDSDEPDRVRSFAKSGYLFFNTPVALVQSFAFFPFSENPLTVQF